MTAPRNRKVLKSMWAILRNMAGFRCFQLESRLCTVLRLGPHHPCCSVRCDPAPKELRRIPGFPDSPTNDRSPVTDHQLRIIRFSWDCVLHPICEGMPSPLVASFPAPPLTPQQIHIVRHLRYCLMRTSRLPCCQEPWCSIKRVSCSPDEAIRSDGKRLGYPRVVPPPVGFTYPGICIVLPHSTGTRKKFVLCRAAPAAKDRLVTGPAS